MYEYGIYRKEKISFYWMDKKNSFFIKKLACQEESHLCTNRWSEIQSVHKLGEENIPFNKIISCC